jgi:hypothetical protein
VDLRPLLGRPGHHARDSPSPIMLLFCNTALQRRTLHIEW